MARSRGVSNYSGNFEVKIQGALDARLLVPTKAELLLDATWKNSGLEYTYIGMIVSVWSDGSNNGVYRLNATDYTNSANWDKLGASGDIISLSTALSVETSNRGSADSSLTSIISTEESNRSSADASLTNRISSEEGTRSGADGSLTSRISAEESNRASAISGEAGTRSGADGSLTSRISAEESNRSSADSSLVSAIGTKLDYRTFGTAANNDTGDFAPASEVGSRVSGDASLSAAISGLNFNLPKFSGYLYSNQTMVTASYWYTINGCAFTLSSGTWLVNAHITMGLSSKGAYYNVVRIVQDTTVVASTQMIDEHSTFGSAFPQCANGAMTSIISVYSSSYIKLEAYCNAANCIVYCYTPTATMGHATQITAVRIGEYGY